MKKLINCLVLVFFICMCYVNVSVSADTEEKSYNDGMEIVEDIGDVAADNKSEALIDNQETLSETDESNKRAESTAIQSTVNTVQDDGENTQSNQASTCRGKMSIDKIDMENGSFQIQILDIDNPQMLRRIDVAVWSEDKGRDDICWYTLKADGSSEYFQNVYIKDHKYSIGKYIVHIYFTNLDSRQYFMGSSFCNIDIQKGTIDVQQYDEHRYSIILNDFLIPGGVRSITVPVWSEVGGQDDIKWYTAERKSDGSYHATFDIKDHKGLGTYAIHVYAVSNSGNYLLIGNTQVSVESPELLEKGIKNYDEESGSFQIVLSKVSNDANIKSIQIPVWSRENGQDDIKWYTAKKRSNGEFYADVDIKDHGYSMGIYEIHMYFTDITGYQYFAGSLQQVVEPDIGEISVEKISNREYFVYLNDAIIPGNVKEIQMPSWSKEGGQDDIEWYKGSKVSGKTYRCRLLLENHKNLGGFNVHIYAKMSNGTMVFLGNTEFETGMPKVEKIESKVIDKSSGKFQVAVSGIENNDLIKEILVPIWSNKNQEDIVWYKAYKNQEGNYIVDANISRHYYNCGKYNIHVYLTDITGVQKFIGSAGCSMDVGYSSLVAQDKGQEKEYTIELAGLEVPSGEQNVQFAVWGAVDGQNDIKWYVARKKADGNYSIEIPIRNHKEFGDYNVHVYCKTKANRDQFVGTTHFEVKSAPSIAAVAVSDIDGTSGSFKVTITGATALSGIEKVQIPMWTTSNQSDIVWYTALKTGEGTYSVNMDVSKHSYHFGTYNIHIYITMGNGVQKMAGATTAKIEACNYVYNKRISDTQREVGIIGAQADRVQFPTWSNVNGQDDIVWYEGINQGNGTWTVVVDSGNHNDGGQFTTHVYVTYNGVMTGVGGTNYSLSWVPKMSGDQIEMLLKSNLYSSSTPYLILVNRTTHKVGVLQGWPGNWKYVQYWDCSDGKASTPTVEGIFRVGSRGYYFDSGDARCYWWTQFYGDYLFHSVLYNKYNGSLMDGRLGMGLSHGCVRLDINNAKWIYDTIPSGTTVVVYH